MHIEMYAHDTDSRRRFRLCGELTGWDYAHYNVHVHTTEKKTERVTLLTTKSFKSFLNEEARRAGISIAELVRIRCEDKRSPEEEILASLAVQLRKAAREAKSSLRESIKEANSALAELQAKRGAGVPAHRKRLK